MRPNLSGLLVVLCLAACGSKGSSGDGATIESAQLITALPSGSSAVIGVDLKDMVDTPLFDLVLQMIGEDAGGLAVIEEQCDADPKKLLRAFVVGVPGALDPQRMTLVAKTSVDRDAIADCARAVARRADIELTVETQGKLTAYQQGDEGTEYVSWIAPDTALLVPSMASDPVVLQQAVTAERLSGVQVELARAIEGPASLWAVADLSRGDRLGEAVGGLPVAERPVAGWAAVDVRSGIKARIGFRFASAAAASAATETLRPRLEAAIERSSSAELFRDSIELAQRGDQLVATLSLSEERASKVYALLSAALPELLSREPPPPD